MTGRQARGQQTAVKILQTALQLFQAHELSIDRLSEQSGVSIGSIYHHFGNLSGVSAALYSECMADLLRSIIRAVGPGTSARDKVLAQARAYLQWTREQEASARFIHASAYASYMYQHAESIRAAKAPILQELMDLFAPHIRAGEVIALPLPLYEILLIGPLAELARRWLSGDSGLDFEAALQHLPERIWQSVKPGDKS